MNAAGLALRIGIDLGGTKIEGIVLDADGEELHRRRVMAPRGDYDETIFAIVDLVHHLENESKSSCTVGVGIPGSIVPATQEVKNANSTWLNGRELQVDLCVALQREVRCENDANCFAPSEATDGAGAGRHVVFGVIVGTGCGGGIAIDGRVHTGRNGLAGEWGHTPLPWPDGDEFPGPQCYCGRRGCLETWISGTGLERDFTHFSGRVLRGVDIEAEARAGDAEAVDAMQRLEDRIARGLAVVVSVLDPDVIVLGGGVSNADRLYPGIRRRLRDYAFGGGVDTPVMKAKHGDSSGVRGAAWLWPTNS